MRTADHLPALAAAAAAALAGLRLTGAVTWPWWVITSPLWGLAALVAAVFAGIILTAAAGRLRR